MKVVSQQRNSPRIWMLLLLVELCRPCLGSVYFVSKEGRGIAPYDSWEKASCCLETVIESIREQGMAANTVLIGPGTWEESSPLHMGHVHHSDTVIIGAGRSLTRIISTNPVVYGNSVDRVTIQDLTLVARGGHVAIRLKGACDDWTLRGMDIVSDVNHSAALLQISGGVSEFARCRMIHGMSRGSDSMALIDADARVNFEYCLFTAAPHDYCIGYIMCAGDQVEFNNCNIMGFGSHGIMATTGMTSVANTIVAGAGVRNRDHPAIDSDATGSVSVVNSLLMGNMWDGDVSPIDCDAPYEMNNIQQSSYPWFRKHPRRGYILPCVDDSIAFGYARELETLLAEYRMKGTYFLTQASWDSTHTEALRAMVSRGVMEAACHAYSHSSLLSQYALEIQYVGSDSNPTAEIGEDRVIRLRTAEGADNYTIDTKQESLDTIGEITELLDVPSWSISRVVYVKGACLARCLAVQERLPVPCELAINPQQFYHDEIVNPRTWMTGSLIGGDGIVMDGQLHEVYDCRTFAPPFGPQTDDSRQVCIDAGYLLSRGRRPVGITASVPKYGVAQVDMDLYAVPFYWGFSPSHGEENQVRASARALAYGIVEAGLAVPVLAHSADEMSLEEWSWCLDEWSRFGGDLVVTSHQLFALEVHDPDGPWHSRGDGTFVRSDQAINEYELAIHSPCIDSGYNRGRDCAFDYHYEDQDLWGAWDIGLHVYKERDAIFP